MLSVGRFFFITTPSRSTAFSVGASPSLLVSVLSPSSVHVRQHPRHAVDDRLHRRVVDLVVRHDPNRVGRRPRDDDDLVFALQRHDDVADVRRDGKRHEADVRLDRGGHLHARDLLQPSREPLHADVVQAHDGPHLAQRHHRRRRERPRLPHAPAARFSQPPALRDERRAPDDHAPDRRAQAFAQAHGHRVRGLDRARGGYPLRDRRVPYPRAVDVQLNPQALTQRAAVVDVRQRQHPPALLVVRLLDAQHGRAREVLVVRPERVSYPLEIDRAVVFVLERPRVRAHQRR
mmetsp:Transcript_14934/g.53749  ORF Transcript_14934/g.53749 Transcript_14934/m.53749 type:complete len:290 (+) Transcript_14934:2591-3460(+)